MDSRLYDILTDIFETDDIDSDTMLCELGADRQDMQEIFMAAEEEFGIETDFKDMDTIKKISDLEKYIASKSGNIL